MKNKTITTLILLFVFFSSWAQQEQKEDTINNNIKTEKKIIPPDIVNFNLGYNFDFMYASETTKIKPNNMYANLDIFLPSKLNIIKNRKGLGIQFEMYSYGLTSKDSSDHRFLSNITNKTKYNDSLTILQIENYARNEDEIVNILTGNFGFNYRLTKKMTL